MLYKITKTYSVVTGIATESVPRTAVTYSLEHKMLHIINSLYFALVTTSQYHRVQWVNGMSQLYA